MSLDELYATFEELQEVQYNRNKFAAALKGLSLDDEQEVVSETKTDFNKIKRRAEKKLAGASDEEIERSEDEDLGLFESKESDW